MFTQICIILVIITPSYQQCTKQHHMEISCSSFLDLRNKTVDFSNVTIIPTPDSLDVRIATVRRATLQLTLADEGATISESKLTQLNELSHNIFGGTLIQTIKSQWFSNSPFKTIHWSYGQISSIEEGAFSQSNELTEISITNHKLTRVKSGIFSDLNFLQKLALSRNHIRLVERNAFRNMAQLKSLYLDHNNLNDFQPEQLFDQGDTLENLYLNGNYITDFDVTLVRGLTNLRVLNLAQNKITEISPYTLEYLTKLERLSLANNLIVDIDPSILPTNAVSHFSTLHISNNRLTYLPSTTLEKLITLKDISIVGNPWQCPCYENLRNWLGEHNIRQVCDEEYSDGSKPVCVVIEEHSSTCSPSLTVFDHPEFSGIINAVPITSECLL